jgi:hypothetical protein
MKRNSTFLLKVVSFVIVIPMVSLFILLLPWVISGLTEVIPVSNYIKYLGFIGLYGAIIPFCFGIYQIIKLFNYIKNKVSSELYLETLKNIKYSSLTVSFLYVLGMPLLYLMADKDDAPGILLFGLIVFLVNCMSAIFSDVFEKRSHAF